MKGHGGSTRCRRHHEDCSRRRGVCPESDSSAVVCIHNPANCGWYARHATSSSGVFGISVMMPVVLSMYRSYRLPTHSYGTDMFVVVCGACVGHRVIYITRGCGSGIHPRPAIITVVLASRVKKLVVGVHSLGVIIPLLSCGASVNEPRVDGNINADLLTLLS